MPWLAYKNALLERMQNSSTIDGLISFILKPRDNYCPIGLWVAERIAERRLLNEDGIEMSEDSTRGSSWCWHWSATKKNKPSRCRHETSVPLTTRGPATTFSLCSELSIALIQRHSGNFSRVTAMTLLLFGSSPCIDSSTLTSRRSRLRAERSWS